MGRSLAAAAGSWEGGQPRFSLLPYRRLFSLLFFFVYSIIAIFARLSVSTPNLMADAMPWCSKNMYIQSWLVALKM
jgi:hypothetical protein